MVTFQYYNMRLSLFLWYNCNAFIVNQQLVGKGKKYLQFSSRFAILSLTGKPVVGWSKDLGPTERAGSLSAVFYWGETSERIEHLC